MDKFVIPKKINILSTNWKIKFHKNDKTKLGWCDNTERTINLVSKPMSVERLEEVFYHELSHAIFFSMGFQEKDEQNTILLAKCLRDVHKQLNKVKNDKPIKSTKLKSKKRK